METNAERDDDDGDSWEAEEPSRVGIIDPAFLKPHSPLDPCFCLQVQRKLSPHLSNGMLPPTTKPGQGKYTTASTLLELIKEVKLAISGRKGRTGTAAGDVAFPKGKENFASVLKRYKQRLSNKPIGTNGGTGSQKVKLRNGVRDGYIVALNIVHLDPGFGMLPVGPGQGSTTTATTIWASRSSTTGPTQIAICHYFSLARRSLILPRSLQASFTCNCDLIAAAVSAAISVPGVSLQQRDLDIEFCRNYPNLKAWGQA
ncbi:hypothetical protein JHK85_054791 [Glycine max]|nr:hypothetical protein JHK85_054791 [Glycine max]